ncbi:MAG TPA: ROK family protein [Acidimicrobiales bacterium]|jgi:glucokinase|nr:ROK family protein [Acidimicrobiales bacterium]|tara:strand:+ start:877 stop:1815 length:939 start_codon:yes stop_codon:yes gene_type:complete
MIVGIDVGGTNARALLIDPADNRIVARDQISSGGTGTQLVAALLKMIERLRSGSGVSVDAVGLAVAGLAHRSGVVRYSPNLPDLVEFPIGPELAKLVGRPVVLGNDATAGALAEHRMGAGRGTDNFGFVTLGTGIGTGFVLDGQLVRGASGFAGESGHMVVDLDGPVHVTGRQGPWEHFGSGNALGRMGRQAAATGGFPAGEATAGSIESITGQHVSDALAGGDHDAARIFDRFCRHVAVGVANLVMIMDLERIVIGGGLVRIGEPLRSGIRTHLGPMIVGSDHRPPVEVVLAALGPDAGALGAGLMADDLL